MTKNGASDDPAEFEWATAIVREEFCLGLESWTSPEFVCRRWNEFCHRDDPVHARVVQALGDEEFQREFVTWWVVGQTIASQSRFWLELAIMKILLHQAKNGPRKMALYVPALQDASEILRRPLSLEELGERQREGVLTQSPWRVMMQQSCLRAIDVLVGEQERGRTKGLQFHRDSRPLQHQDSESFQAIDREQIRQVAATLTGPPLQGVTLRCSLIVVEPDRLDDKPHVWAIRLVNPKTLARHAERKQERTNLLRVIAYLLQEKALRPPGGIEACVAEIVPRRTPTKSDKYSDYFSDLTYWPSSRFWEFVGVPFAAIERGIDEAGASFSGDIRKRLHQATVQPQPSLFDG